MKICAVFGVVSVSAICHDHRVIRIIPVLLDQFFNREFHFLQSAEHKLKVVDVHPCVCLFHGEIVLKLVKLHLWLKDKEMLVSRCKLIKFLRLGIQDVAVCIQASTCDGNDVIDLGFVLDVQNDEVVSLICVFLVLNDKIAARRLAAVAVGAQFGNVNRFIVIAFDRVNVARDLFLLLASHKGTYR